MVRGSPVRAQLRRGAALPVVCALLWACGADVTTPRGEEPFLYLVLGQPSLSHYASLEAPVQQALLTTTGSPLESPSYLAAGAFRMTREEDGAPFGWQRHSRLVSEPGTRNRLSVVYANYALPDSAGPGELGGRDLRPGETYHLVVETELGTIEGTTTIPAAFSIREARGADQARYAAWPRVAGAAAYHVGMSDGSSVLQTDTTARLPDAVSAGGFVYVQALDPNLWHYLTDDGAARAGIAGGYGVFGAVSNARLEIAGAAREPRPRVVIHPEHGQNR